MGDILIEIYQSEYDDLVEQINMLQELIAELSKEKQPEQFKPVSEYTLADWDLAMNEGWVFECRKGNEVTIRELIDLSDRPVFCSAGYFHSLNGMWDVTEGEDADDIIKRIK